MEVDSDNEIPAFYMWKMFNDTMPALLNYNKYNESNVEHLVNIVKSKEFSTILVYSRDGSLSYEEYSEMSKKYKAFTIWLLGRFFNLLNADRLSRLHDLIVDAQLSILQAVAFKESSIFSELTAEYINALEQMIDCHKRKLSTKQIVAFSPQVIDDLKNVLDLSQNYVEINTEARLKAMILKILVIIEYITIEKITYYSINNLDRCLESLLYLLYEGDIDLKIKVLEVYMHIVEKPTLNMRHLTNTLYIEKFEIYVALIEQLLYDLYTKKIKTTNERINKFTEILCVILKYPQKQEFVHKRLDGMADFLFQLLRTNNDLKNILSEANMNNLWRCSSQLLSVSVTKTPFLNDANSYLDLNEVEIESLLLILGKYITLEIKEHCKINKSPINVLEASTSWKKFESDILETLQNTTCSNKCYLKNVFNIFLAISHMTIKIKLGIYNFLMDNTSEHFTIYFFEEGSSIVSNLSFLIESHIKFCRTPVPIEQLLKIFSFLPVSMHPNQIFTDVLRIMWPFEDIRNYRSTGISETVLRHIKDRGSQKKEDFLIAIWNLVDVISSKLVNTTQSSDAIVNIFYKAIRECKQNLKVSHNLANIVTYLWTSSDRTTEILRLIFQYAVKNQRDKEYENEILGQYKYLHCILESDFFKLISWNDNSMHLNVDIICEQCMKKTFNNLKTGSTKQHISKSAANRIKTVFGVYHSYQNKPEIIEELRSFWKDITNFKAGDNMVKKIQILPILAKHTTWVHTDDPTKYKNIMESNDSLARQEFANIISLLFTNILEHKNLSKRKKNTIICDFLSDMKCIIKESLQIRNFNLQETLIETLRNICGIQHEDITLKSINMLLILIMVPSSKHSLLAVNAFIKMTELYSKKGSLYTVYKEEICNDIVKLCALNQLSLNYGLGNSLERISLVLGFFGTKDFLIQEHQHLLPFFIPIVIKHPAVSKLLEEMTTLIDQDLSDLLTNNYGNIFLHIFLNETEDVFKKSMKYLEENTGLSGSYLRKLNFKVLLNKLLLNFHEKRDRVLLALKILAQEDSDGQAISIQQIPDYIQPKFLGVLVYFDTKLNSSNSNKKKILLSLAQIFKLMGPKRIGSFRFKIIAMLRTVLNSQEGELAELNCEIWNTFVRTCDLEVLGPQLATIFISILPLIRQYPEKINGIFKYLAIENKEKLTDYLPDLFFIVDSTEIDYEVILVIKKCMETFEQKSFQEQLKSLLKYLMHETLDIRVHALKFLKRIMEKNREELDQMILAYNGIDPTIVELVDILTLGCREKDLNLKLACGDCIGELGAIEPSHFPRRCTQDADNFIFFITEDAFVINALNELTRALQAENNTQNMDRYSLAIQETLKIFEISPSESSSRHHVWNGLPDSQRELMMPLLSSRYTLLPQNINSNIAPIYGSTLGSTFQAWAFNWMCSLISNTKQETKSILQVYLPSLKHDYRTMMLFLPHILLHSLVEGTPVDQQKIYDEIMCIIYCFSTKPPLDIKILNTRPLCTTNRSFTPKQKSSEVLRQVQCTKVVFILLDYLERWTREFEWQKGASCRTDDSYQIIKAFLKHFCKLQLAKVNFQCGEYPRALMYLEDYVTDNSHEFRDNHYFLSEIYAQLGEPDGVAGISALQYTEPSLEERILALEVSGKLAEAAACYERMSPPLKLRHLQGLVQCYLDLDNVNSALNFAVGALKRQPEYTDALLEIEAEPLWRLGCWDDLDNLIKCPQLKGNKSWGVQIGHALIHLRKGNRDQFQNVLNFLKGEQVSSFGEASLKEGAYQHGYNYIAKLHALNELEQVEKVIYELMVRPNDENACESVLKKLIAEWELRIKVVQESTKIIEPILCLRRVALEQAKELIRDKAPHAIKLLDSLLGECWLLSTKTARAASVHQQAYTYTIKAEEYAPPRLFLEKAKLHWLREEHEQALSTLKRGLEKLIPEHVAVKSTALNALTLEEKKLCAEAKLLIASYNDSTSNVDKDVNIQHYKEAVEMFREWEKSLVCLAQYYDRIFQTFSDEDRDAKGSDMQIHMINYFGKSLLYGTTYVYQSMPRLLSIWFDYGSRLLEVTDAQVKEERKGMLLKMTKLIDSFLERLPSYIFLTAFSQLVSRICHPQKEVYIELKSIIIKLILQYPQQSLWMIIPVIKSSYSVRSKRCTEIFNDSRLKTPVMSKFIGDFTKLAERLIELCNKEINENISKTSVNTLVRNLPRLLAKNDFSEIMMPTHKFRKLVLPNPDFKSSQHNPFPNHYVHIIGIEDEIQILPSLQRPRKIILKGSDGKGYIQMLKPKDDLRKDFRLMEFNDIVNQLLSRDAQSRQRRLHIRLYSVAPLNEECGLIEWVPNLIGLRPVLLSLYRQHELGMRPKELKENCCNQRDSFSKKKDIFLKKFLPKHPPILGEWFKKTFPDAQSWLNARTAYIRTTAVISMTGYILGLGDRHGENILLDSTCGDTVHVDFNCLFNKGESFEWPERVPFRLTHNMVSAMGPLGVEGVFRKSCACTLRVLRTNINTLMSIVTPFVYDPLVSWPRNVGATTSTNAERTNEQAVEHIRNIKLRLQGMMRTKGRSFSIPLSVEGQTNNLILEAVSIDNLCQMYIGWGPYL